MTDIRALLTSVYHDSDVDKLMVGIDQLIQSYQKKVSLDPLELDESDVLMITYGDQVHRPGEAKLSSLKAFLDEHLANSIKLVHLLPFYPYSSDDGFSVIDYYEVNEDMGDWSDIDELSKNYSLMFDGVINHISQESDWLKGYLQGKKEYAGYFKEADPSEDFSAVTRPRTSPVFHEFVDHQGESKYLWTTFSKDQVDLNYETPELFLQVLDVMLFYLSNGAKLLRLDAIGFMWKEKGSTCIHLPQAHALIQVMRQVLEKIYPDVVLISETNVPHQENITYFGNGYNEAKMVYNFTLPPLLAFSLLSQSTAKFRDWASSLELPSDQVCFFNFTASHDGVGVRPVQGILTDDELNVLVDSVKHNNGFVSYKTNPDGSESPYELNCNYKSLLKGVDNNSDFALKRFLLSQAVMMCMPGLPAIYFHSLVGSENFTEGVKQTGRNRTINREKLDLNDLNDQLKDNSSDRAKILTRIKQLIKIRASFSCFNPFASFSIPEIEDGLLCIARTSRDNQITLKCVFNFTAHQKANPYAAGADVLTGKPAPNHIDAFGFVWINENASHFE